MDESNTNGFQIYHKKKKNKNYKSISIINSNITSSLIPSAQLLTKPIRYSYGIICLRSPRKNILNHIQEKIAYSKEDIQNIDVLMICPKHSYNYIEFILGNYDITNISYLISLFNYITPYEKHLLLHLSFEEIWEDMWGIEEIIKKKNIREFHKSKYKFEKIRNGFIIDFLEINQFINLQQLLNNFSIEWTNPEWGFPKGKKEFNETDVNCALREFEEETGILSNNITPLPITPLFEQYEGTNYKLYNNTYYIYEYISDNDPNIIIQKKELSNVQWIPIHLCHQYIRPYFLLRNNILHYLTYILHNPINTPPSNNTD
jgi:8-oxo-dGTP pyrophosphatase MutT (NUDIX family)